MLFGKIDIDLVLAGFYAQLKPATRDVLHVISAVANFNTGEFFHSEESLGTLAGCSSRTVRRALHELLHPPWLENHEQSGTPGIISVARVRPGRPTIYVYNFLARAEDRGGYSTDDPRPKWDPEFIPPPSMTYPADTDVLTPRTPMSTKQEPPNEDLFTTTAADRVAKSLITRLRDKYDDRLIDVVLFAMKSMNGEVENANAYFHACVKNGWIPTSKKAKQKKAAREREEAARIRREEERRIEEKMRAEIEHEMENPEIQARIQAEIEKANRILGIQE